MSCMPCQGCGELIVFKPREIDGLNVCRSCASDTGIMAITMIHQRTPDVHRVPIFCKKMACAQPGKHIKQRYMYNEQHRLLQQDPGFDVLPPPLSYHRIQLRRNTFASPEVQTICDLAYRKCLLWSTFYASFKECKLRMRTLQKACSFYANGVLTLDAFWYVSNDAPHLTRAVSHAEDVRRCMYFSQLYSMPSCVTVISSEVLPHVDVYALLPCAVFCENASELDAVVETIRGMLSVDVFDSLSIGMYNKCVRVHHKHVVSQQTRDALDTCGLNRDLIELIDSYTKGT